MTTVATWNIHNQIWNSAANVQALLNKTQIQEASGLIAQDFATLGGSTSIESLNLEGQINQSKAWYDSATRTTGTTQVMFDAINAISKTMGDLQEQISAAISSPNPENYTTTISSLLSNMVSAMNSQFDGQYVFSGTDGNTRPVNMTDYPKLNSTAPYYTGASSDTSYYSGNSMTLSVRVSQQQTVMYGVNADNPAFEKAIRSAEIALQALTTGTINNSSVTGNKTFPSDTTPLYLFGSFAINGGGKVDIDSNDTLQDIATKINAAAGSSDVSASVSATAPYGLTITTTGSSLTFNGQSGTVLTGLGITPTPLGQGVITDTLTANNELINQAVNSLGGLLQSVSANARQIQEAAQQQTSFTAYIQTTLSNIKGVNTGQVASDVSLYQTQLQASYMAVSSLSKMNLAQYL